MKFDLGHIAKIAVVNVELTSGAPLYHYLILKSRKGEIDFIKQGENINDFSVLMKQLSNKYPVLLHFTGKGILNRSVSRQENYRHTILLNANMDDFYFSDYLEEKEVFSSVIRKDTVEENVQAFTEKKIQVISVSSGPFFSALLAGIIGKDELRADGFSLKFDDDILTGFSKTVEQIRGSVLLGNERISERQLTCAAIGAAFFNPSDKLVFPESEIIFEVNKEEARQKNIFARFGMGMMLFFLVLLFGNYLYLGHLNTVYAENAAYLIQYEDQLGQIQQLDDERIRKEKLLKSSGLLNKNFLSFYLMELANSVPSTITFDEVVVRPLMDEIKSKKKIAFEEHLVRVNGRSKSSRILSNWIEEIEQKEWLSKVDILDYNYEKNEGYFQLEIIVF